MQSVLRNQLITHMLDVSIGQRRHELKVTNWMTKKSNYSKHNTLD